MTSPSAEEDVLDGPGNTLDGWVVCPSCGSDNVDIVLSRYAAAVFAGLVCQDCDAATWRKE